MKLCEIKKVYQEMIAVKDIMETGFVISADDIFVMHSGDKAPYALRVMAKQGELTFIVDVAQVDSDANTFRREWSAVVELYNAAPKPERRYLLESSQSRRRAGEILGAMVVKGFRRPEHRSS